MIKGTKKEILHNLASISDVIFVGGTSEYLQGIKTELNDIDISISDLKLLNGFGYIHKNFDNAFYGLSGHRGFIPLENALIDIFIDKNPDYIMVNGFKCETVQSMILLREKTLKFNHEKLSEKSKHKIRENLDRLLLWSSLNIHS
ncbi:hypothetical protein [uncultured Chryseobacterium sp.]|uniref:hypothetical protein n=1 Tax=uncultured Chryseobacterium sp. TaxID=259322 RepID=UPI0025F48AAF|nr:hypothetical protein [uncultured Chryseobacterium sp.]